MKNFLEHRLSFLKTINSSHHFYSFFVALTQSTEAIALLSLTNADFSVQNPDFTVFNHLKITMANTQLNNDQITEGLKFYHHNKQWQNKADAHILGNLMQAIFALNSESNTSCNREQNYCKVCGGSALLSVINQNAERFLQCELCSHQWRFVRAKCIYCNSTNVSYATIEDKSSDKAAITSEICNDCKYYIKQIDSRNIKKFDGTLLDILSFDLDMKLAHSFKRVAINPLVAL